MTKPKGLVPDRTSVPNPDATLARDPSEVVVETEIPVVGPKRTTNSVEGLTDPDVEAQAPGRPTHGATNNP